IQHIQHLGIDVENLWEPRTVAAPSTQVAQASKHPPSRFLTTDENRLLCAMLFSDVKGYSKLREEEIFDFSKRFLAGIARLIAESDAQPIACNTWGDGLFLVFANVR